ncbi:uncharacterized protein [Oscarella lobularis]|uniref:uncharacterized protein n=1 Tax=Oscarella lobularis TaxID=121494 RepID=UPI003313280F
MVFVLLCYGYHGNCERMMKVNDKTYQKLPSQLGPTSSHNQEKSLISDICSENSGNEWCFVNKNYFFRTIYPPNELSFVTCSYQRATDEPEKVLLYGDKYPFTWLYTPWSNSWETLLPRSSPTGRVGPVLERRSETSIILIGGATNTEKFTDTWLFSGSNENWTEVAVTSRSEPPPPLDEFAVSTTFYQNKSRCQCKTSIFVFVNDPSWVLPNYELPFWELRCVSDMHDDVPLFQWIKGNAQFSKVALQNFFLSWALSVNDGTIKLIGLTDLSPTISAIVAATLNLNAKIVAVESLTKRSYVPPELIMVLSTQVTGFLFAKENATLFVVQRIIFAYNWTSKTWIYGQWSNPTTSRVAVPTTGSKYVVKMADHFLMFRVPLSDTEIPSTTLTHKFTAYFDTAEGEEPIVRLYATLLPPTVDAPMQLIPRTFSYALVGSFLYIYGGLRTYASGMNFVYSKALLPIVPLWSLDLKAVQWQQYRPYKSPPVLANHCGSVANGIFLQFGGNSAVYDNVNIISIYDYTVEERLRLRETIQSGLLGFDTKSRQWTQFISFSDRRPKGRMRCSMTSMASGSVLLFGGVYISSDGSLTELNDMWLLTIRRENSEGYVASWKLLTTTKYPGKTGPASRYNAMMEVLEGSPIVYGGRAHNSTKCFDNVLWVYNFARSTWKGHELFYDNRSGFSRPRGNDCLTLGAIVGNKVAISYDFNTGIQSPHYDKRVYVSSTYVWDVKERFVFELEPLPRDANQVSMLSYKNKLISLGISNGEKTTSSQKFFIFYLPHLGCPGGHYTENFATKSCRSCGIGAYAQSASSACKKCPVGTITANVNAENVSRCYCNPNYCDYGKCTLTYKGGKISALAAQCTCDPGYTGGTCRYPTFYLVGFGIVLMTTLFTLMAVCIHKYRQSNLARQRKLQQLRKTLNISETDLVMLERVDGDCRGGYSKVSKATYRGMSYVVVKELEMDIASLDASVLYEFIREIELMTVLNHKNIVRFFGAGTFEATQGPFLVVEHAYRGSLKNILYRSPYLVTNEMKRSFCLDTAEGMNYLHTQIRRKFIAI